MRSKRAWSHVIVLVPYECSFTHSWLSYSPFVFVFFVRLLFFLLVCGRLSVASFVGVRLFHLISFYRS